MAADEPYSVFEASCQSFVTRPLIGIITKIDSPNANVPMVRQWLINSGCYEIFPINNVTGEGVDALIEYLNKTPRRITLEEAKERQRNGLPEWDDE